VKITNTEIFKTKWRQRLCLQYHRRRFYRAVKHGVALRLPRVSAMYCTGNAEQLFVAVVPYVMFLFCPNVKQILSIRVLNFLRIRDHTF
jgi:hypothetical protein